jgi:hypothetical protein
MMEQADKTRSGRGPITQLRFLPRQQRPGGRRPRQAGGLLLGINTTSTDFRNRSNQGLRRLGGVREGASHGRRKLSLSRPRSSPGTSSRSKQPGRRDWPICQFSFCSPQQPRHAPLGPAVADLAAGHGRDPDRPRLLLHKAVARPSGAAAAATGRVPRRDRAAEWRAPCRLTRFQKAGEARD